MTSRFQTCLAVVLGHEGGYSDVKQDRGGKPESAEQSRSTVASLISGIQTRIRDTGFFRPVFQALCSPVKGDRDCSPKVLGLFCQRYPATVSRSVVGIWVNSVDAKPIGTLPHVGQECLERPVPSVAHFDASAAVDSVPVATRVVTPVTHIPPSEVRRVEFPSFSVAGKSVGSSGFGNEVAFSATARRGMAATNLTDTQFDIVATRTSEEPNVVVLPTGKLLPFHETLCNKVAECVTRYVHTLSDLRHFFLLYCDIHKRYIITYLMRVVI